MSETYRKESYLLISEPVPKGQGSLRDFSRNKGATRYHFPPLHPSINTGPPTGTSGVPTLPVADLPFPVMLA